MKFERLSVEKYGAISEREIDLAEKAGLVIVFGPNEAGKSTLLCAVRDLLFGVPHTSPHGSIFGNNNMRIGANLRLGDGSVLSLRRRKGRSPGDLTDADGSQVPVGQMEALLGGTDRDRFGALFGLDHISLREGGQKLLDADGEIGRLIVEAGGGLRALVSAMSELENEADSLFSSTRSIKRKFYPACDAFQTADKAVKQATTTREAYLKAQKSAQAAFEALELLRAEQKSARATISRLERLKRTAPQFQLLAELEGESEQYADVEQLADSVASEISVFLDARETNLKTVAASEQTVSSLEKAMAPLDTPDEFFEAAEEIVAAAALASHVEKSRLDLPKRLIEMSESQSHLEKLRELLALDDSVDLKGMAPERANIGDVQTLITRGAELQSSIAAARLQVAETEEGLKALRDLQSDRENKGFHKPSSVSAAELLKLPQLTQELEIKTKELADHEDQIEQKTHALGLDPKRHLTCVWPSKVEVKSQLDRQEGIRSEIRQARTARAEAKKRCDGAVRRIADLEKGAPPPTPAAITNARLKRDDQWRDIRTQYLDAPDEGWTRPSMQQRDATAEQFERSKAAADDLVDRSSSEAQRLADIAAAERDKSDAETGVAVALQRIDDLEQSLTESKKTWSTSWPEASSVEEDLSRLLAITEARENLLAQQAALGSQRTALERIKQQVADLRILLGEVEHGYSVESGGPISLRVQAAVALLKSQDDQYAFYQRDTEELSKHVARAERWQRTLADLLAEYADWSGAWSKAVSKLGLKESATPQQATEVATEWAAAPGVFNAIELTSKRITAINQDDNKLNAAVEGLGKRLNVDCPEDAVAAARLLNRLLEEMSGKKGQRDALLPKLSQARQDLEVARLQILDTESQISQLASNCQCEVDGLSQVVTRIDARKELRAKLETLRSNIVIAGDGLTFDILKDEWRHQNPDDLAGQLNELSEDVERRERDIEAAIVHKQTMDGGLKAFIDDDQLNSLIAERETAAAEMHQVIERYMEVSLALSLLKAAIERVRSEQQDPLLSRASELFAASTRGQFSGIGTDVGSDGQPVVVGIRQGGESVALSEMSDGTRDQLFLAFRLASIEHYAKNAEPIPFIADDILVHFDDDRSQAALAGC